MGGAQAQEGSATPAVHLSQQLLRNTSLMDMLERIDASAAASPSLAPPTIDLLAAAIASLPRSKVAILVFTAFLFFFNTLLLSFWGLLGYPLSLLRNDTCKKTLSVSGVTGNPKPYGRRAKGGKEDILVQWKQERMRADRRKTSG